jgi:hypothetical protein
MPSFQPRSIGTWGYNRTERGEGGGGTLSASCDEGVESDGVGEASLVVHLVEELQGQLPLPCLFARRYEAAVRDDAAFTTLVHHLLENLHHLRHALTFRCRNLTLLPVFLIAVGFFSMPSLDFLELV